MKKGRLRGRRGVRKKGKRRKRFIAVHVVPTGLRASVGGYVGDATPATNKMAAVCDCMIVHPNVVNGVMLNCAAQNVLYVEGYSLDRFFLGEVALRTVERNKIGVILDDVDERHYNFGVNQVNSVVANKGIDVAGIVRTREKIKCGVFRSRAGAYIGRVGNQEVIFEAVRRLRRQGAQAIMISTASPMAFMCFPVLSVTPFFFSSCHSR